MGILMAQRADYPLIGPWLAQDGAVYLLSYGGLILDMLALPFLVMD